MSRIHVLGGAGSGTTTLAAALAGKLRVPHFDSDDYYWIPSVPPYRIKRDKAVRDVRLDEDLRAFDDWIWSGSAVSWKLDLSRIELVVFLTIPADLRLARLERRENLELGSQPGIAAEEQQAEIREFLDWARQYDDGGLEVRSRQLHESWLAQQSCPILRIDGDTTTEERVQQVMDAIR